METTNLMLSLDKASFLQYFSFLFTESSSKLFCFALRKFVCLKSC